MQIVTPIGSITHGIDGRIIGVGIAGVVGSRVRSLLGSKVRVSSVGRTDVGLGVLVGVGVGVVVRRGVGLAGSVFIVGAGRLTACGLVRASGVLVGVRVVGLAGTDGSNVLSFNGCTGVLDGRGGCCRSSGLMSGRHTSTAIVVALAVTVATS